MKIFTFFLLLLVVAVLFGAHDLIAQPPTMLGDPEQSPIDGGLSIVALADGAYALKKLRNKK